MSNLQLIERLCALVEVQAAVVRSLAASLAQERALTTEETLGILGIRSVEDDYTSILGDEEWDKK